jgi:hypothetical protein
MHSAVITVVDAERGCGKRKPGGVYLRGDGVFEPCGKLPIPLGVCPFCHGGIKITRGLQQINLKMLQEPIECNKPDCGACLTKSTEWAWLMSVGEKFYKMPADFMREAFVQGISKRIHQIPHGFKVGESVVALAHKKACVSLEPQPEYIYAEGTPESMFENQESLAQLNPLKPKFAPGIFTLFRPSRIEYVARGDEMDEEIEKLLKRGIQPVQVLHETQGELPGLDEGETEGNDNE